MKVLLVGGALLFLGVVALLWAHISAGPPAKAAAAKSQPVAVQLQPPAVARALTTALWPMARPAWCKEPQAWGLAVPPGKGARIVPACTIAAGRVFVGIWPAQGCTAYKPQGAAYQGQGVVVDGNGKPNANVYTVCK